MKLVARLSGLAAAVAAAPLILGLAAAAGLQTAQAFQLSPIGTKAERRQAGRSETAIRAEIFLAESALHKFADPVHETLTQLIFDCGNDWADCADPDLEQAGAYVIAGVRWNDDPVFMLGADEGKGLKCRLSDSISFITQTRCWIGLFKDAEQKAARDPLHFTRPGQGNYMSRSHFGDLQFLHAMAAGDGESAERTRDKLLMWAEFSWGVATGRFGLDTRLRSVDVAGGWQEHFANGQNVQDLFTVGRPWLRPHIRSVAFGSLLHLVQDSFAEGHVQRREPISGAMCNGGQQRQAGRIQRFHSYAQQDHDKHREADGATRARRHLALHKPHVVDVGRVLRDYLDRGAPWAQVRGYLQDCVFALDEEVGSASPGAAFQREP